MSKKRHSVMNDWSWKDDSRSLPDDGFSGKIYAVRVGRQPGIYHCWDDCRKQVIGYSGAVYKGFKSYEMERAYAFLVGPDPHWVSKAGKRKKKPKSTLKDFKKVKRNHSVPRLYGAYDGEPPPWDESLADGFCWLRG